MIPDGDWSDGGGGVWGGAGFITTKLTTKHTCNGFLEHLTMEIYAVGVGAGFITTKLTTKHTCKVFS